MGNNHSRKFLKYRKSACVTEQVQIESEDLSDSFELNNIPNNEIYISASRCDEFSSETLSNKDSSDQALKICMEHPNFMSGLSKNIDRQELILKNEYREAILCNITNSRNETSEIHFESDYLYL